MRCFHLFTYLLLSFLLVAPQTSHAFRLGSRAELAYERPSSLSAAGEKVAVGSGSGLGYGLMLTTEPLGSKSWGIATNLGMRGTIMEWGSTLDEGGVKATSKANMNCPRVEFETGGAYRPAFLSIPVLVSFGYPLGCKYTFNATVTVGDTESKIDAVRELTGYGMRFGSGIGFEFGQRVGFGLLASYQNLALSYKDILTEEKQKLTSTNTVISLFFEFRFVNHRTAMAPGPANKPKPVPGAKPAPGGKPAPGAKPATGATPAATPTPTPAPATTPTP